MNSIPASAKDAASVKVVFFYVDASSAERQRQYCEPAFICEVDVAYGYAALWEQNP